MNGKRIYALVGMALLAGGLFVASIGPATAQTPPTPTPGAGPGPGMMQGWGGHGPGMMQASGGQGHMGSQHTAMQAVLAGALGITVEELQAELAAGKTVPQIAQERGVDLATVHETMLPLHQAMGGAGHDPGSMHGAAGNGSMGGQAGGICPHGGA